jgi:hypothetical protein
LRSSPAPSRLRDPTWTARSRTTRLDDVSLEATNAGNSSRDNQTQTHAVSPTDDLQLNALDANVYAAFIMPPGHVNGG